MHMMKKQNRNSENILYLVGGWSAQSTKKKVMGVGANSTFRHPWKVRVNPFWSPAVGGQRNPVWV